MGTPELVALMLADGRLPTGGHTQSAGLEPAVRAGLGANGNHLEDVAEYARDRLHTVTRVEAAVAVVTRHLILSPSTNDPPSPSRANWLHRDSPSRGSWSGKPANHDLDPRLVERAGRLSATDWRADGGGQLGGAGPGERDTRPGPDKPPAGMGPDRPTAGVGPDRPTAGVGADETPARVGPGEPDTGPGPDKPAAERGPDKLPAGVGPGQSVIGVGPGEPVGGVGPGRSVVGVGPGEPTGGVGSGQSVVGAGLGGWGVGLGWVEGVWAARTPSQVLRGVSRRQGRLLLRLAGRVWPEVLEYLPDDGEVPRPIVLGVVAAVNGLSAEQLARTVAYEDAQTVVSASLKLLPVDPADAAAWLAGLHDDIERLVKDVAPLTDPDTIPADGAPLIDVFAHQHSTERMRLFNA